MDDLVAIFHCSFHPTKGNIIDWFRKSDDALDLEGVEFNALPSGLHVLEQDIIHFTKGAHHGICLFQRQETRKIGMRGYYLHSIGVLVVQSPRPRPWRHIRPLRNLLEELASQSNDDWKVLEAYFESNRSSTIRKDLDYWDEWEKEYANDFILNQPTLQVTRLIRSFGPFFFTVYKHVLGGRRVLIYTQPPVESACVLAQVFSDLCLTPKSPITTVTVTLGMVTLNDIGRLKHCKPGGWIACSTDRVFFEKPELYDLIVDLSSEIPILYVSKQPQKWFQGSIQVGNQSSVRLQAARFTWSDVANWDGLDRSLVNPMHKTADSERPKWSDPWDVYNAAYVLFARYWLGNPQIPSSSALITERMPFRQSILQMVQRRTLHILTTLEEITSNLQSSESSTISLTPAVLSSFDLVPLSASDAKFIEWLSERSGRKVVIKRAWKNLVCVALGLD